MTPSTPSAHYAAIGIFLLSAVWVVILTAIWLRKTEVTIMRKIFVSVGVAIFSLIAMPIMIYYSLPASAQTPPQIPPGSCNVIGNNNVNCNNFIVAPSRLQFSEDIGRKFLEKMQAKKLIRLTSYGGNADQRVADQFQGFFESKGFEVARTMILMGAPDGKLGFMETQDAYLIMIAPSAT